MHHIYLYGAADDCHECETTFGNFESYYGFEIGPIQAYFIFDGDWGIWLESEEEFPSDWIIKAIEGNCASDVKGKAIHGQFIHIQVPEPVKIVELTGDE